MEFKVTWEQFELFLRVDKSHSQHRSAADADRCRFRIFERWFTGKEWSVLNFRTFLSEYQKREAKQGTLNKLISFGKYLDEYMGTEVTKGFKTKVERAPKIEAILTPFEIQSLANVIIPYDKKKAFMNQRAKALIMLLGLSGCRIGEALGLKWENLSEFPMKHAEFVETKNGEDRTVWLDDDLFELLTQLPKKSKFVFSSFRGGSLGSAEFNHDLKRRAETLGIKKRVYAHLFRHSLATTLGEQGISDSDICKMIGWKDPRMLLRYKNSQLEYFRSLMELHPLLQNKLSYQQRMDRLMKDVERLFDPRKHTITPSVKEGEIVLTIHLINPSV